VETEERLIETERDNRAQLERLSRELADSEAQERVLAVRIETLQRELAEAEQSAAAERAAARRAEGALAEKVAGLDAQAAELRRELEAERAARLRAEQTIEALRLGHRRLELIAHELRAGMADLRAAAAAGTAAAAQTAAAQAPVWQRPEQSGAAPAAEPIAGRPQPAAPASPVGSGPGNGEMVEALAAAVERLRARVAEGPVASPTAASAPPRHKHSMSLIGRWRMARKQRRQR
jgi:DNA repair exonuclease SbcCD ATPase subunit